MSEALGLSNSTVFTALTNVNFSETNRTSVIGRENARD